MTHRAWYSNAAMTSSGQFLQKIPNATIRLFLPGTTTPYSGTIYKEATGVDTWTNPFDTDPSGIFSFYLEEAIPLKIRITGVGLGGPIDYDYQHVMPDSRDISLMPELRRQLGADPTGVNSSDVAFASWLAACGGTSGYLGEGDFRIDDEYVVPAGTRWYGDGIASSIIKRGPDASVDGSGTSITNPLQFGANCVVRDIGIDGNSPNTDKQDENEINCEAWLNGDRIFFENVRLFNPTGTYAVQISGDDVTFLRCFFEGNGVGTTGVTPLNVSAWFQGGANTKRLKILHSDLRNYNWGTGILGQEAIFLGNTVENNHISEEDSAGGTGMQLGVASDVVDGDTHYAMTQIIGNWFGPVQNTTTGHIEVQGSSGGCLIEANIMVGRAETLNAAVFIAASARKTSCKGNEIRGMGGNGIVIGTYSLTGSGDSMVDADVVGNKVYDCGGSGIVLYRPALVADNTCMDNGRNASAIIVGTDNGTNFPAGSIPDRDGIHVAPGVSRALVVNNVCADTRSGGSKTQRYGVRFDIKIAGGSDGDYNQCRGNTCVENAQAAGLLFESAGANNIFRDNLPLHTNEFSYSGVPLSVNVLQASAGAYPMIRLRRNGSTKGSWGLNASDNPTFYASNGSTQNLVIDETTGRLSGAGFTWTTFTPHLVQSGNISTGGSVTVDWAEYAIVGKTAYVNIQLTVVTATGAVTNNAIKLQNIPAAIQPRRTGNTAPVGQGIYLDSGNTILVGNWIAVGASDWRLATQGNGDWAGILPNFAVAANDIIGVNAVYELA